MAKRAKRKRHEDFADNGGDSVDRSLTDRAYQQIKEEILTNRLRPGDPLRVEFFVKRLKISRTPMREAIQQLEKEGLVEIRSRIGTFVSHIELREIVEMYQVRQMLEGFAARLAAGRVEPGRLAEVESQLTRLQTGENVEYAAVSKAGLELHRIIVESCGNLVLTRFVLSLQDHFRRFRSASPQLPERILEFHEDHLRILEALKRGDGPKAEQLIQQHLERAAQLLMERLLPPRGPKPATPCIVRVTSGAETAVTAKSG
ncbi:MAG: GntR family transcriptional regulator [Acidobacteria bacterium]|nr:MAG: GntR family transcriptional regulator [Acidobacteriota bacterium]